MQARVVAFAFAFDVRLRLRLYMLLRAFIAMLLFKGEPLLEAGLGHLGAEFQRRESAEQIPSGVELSDLHLLVDVDVPQVDTFRAVRCDELLEDSASSLHRAALELVLSITADHEEVLVCGEALESFLQRFGGFFDVLVPIPLCATTQSVWPLLIVCVLQGGISGG